MDFHHIERHWLPIRVRATAVPVATTNLLLQNPTVWHCEYCSDTNKDLVHFFAAKDSNDLQHVSDQDEAGTNSSAGWDNGNMSIYSYQDIENSADFYHIPHTENEGEIDVNSYTNESTRQQQKALQRQEQSSSRSVDSEIVNEEIHLDTLLEAFSRTDSPVIAGRQRLEMLNKNDIEIESGFDIAIAVVALGVLVSFAMFLLNKMRKIVAHWWFSRFDRYIDALEKQVRFLLTNKEYERVIATLKRNIPKITERLGPNHSDVAAFWHFLAKAHLLQGDLTSAESAVSHVLTIYEPYGEDTFVAMAFEDLSITLRAQGLERAEDSLTAALTSLRIYTDDALYKIATLVPTCVDALNKVSAVPAVSSPSRSIKDQALQHTRTPTSSTRSNGNDDNGDNNAGLYAEDASSFTAPTTTGDSVVTNISHGGCTKLGYKGNLMVSPKRDGSLNDFFWSPACKASARKAAWLRNGNTHFEYEQEEGREPATPTGVSAVASVAGGAGGAVQSLANSFDEEVDFKIALNDLEKLLASPTTADSPPYDVDPTTDDATLFDHHVSYTLECPIDKNVARLQKSVGVLLFEMGKMRDAKIYFEAALAIFVDIHEMNQEAQHQFRYADGSQSIGMQTMLNNSSCFEGDCSRAGAGAEAGETTENIGSVLRPGLMIEGEVLDKEIADIVDYLEQLMKHFERMDPSEKFTVDSPLLQQQQQQQSGHRADCIAMERNRNYNI